MEIETSVSRITPADGKGPLATRVEDGDPYRVGSIEALYALYDAPGETSLRKEADHLTPAYARMLAAAPFCALGTIGPGGLDVSPRGDGPGFVAVLDPRTLALPDRRGNNRLDSLRNVVADPRVALLFLLPGVAECLRINGRAHVTADPALLERFVVEGKRPATALRIAIDTVYFQCARAIVRAQLWDPERHVDRAALPTAGEMTKDAYAAFDAEAYDAALPARQAATLY